MLNDEHSVLLLNHLSHNVTMKHDIDYSVSVEVAEYNLVSILKPKIYKDGDQWCVLYGDNLQDGVCGFGETPYRAVLDFNKAWNTK